MSHSVFFQNQPSIQCPQEVSGKQPGEKSYDRNKAKMRVKIEKNGRQGGEERCRKKVRAKAIIRVPTIKDDEQKYNSVSNTNTNSNEGTKSHTRLSVAVPGTHPHPATRKQWQSGYVSPVTRLKPLGKVDRFKEQCRGIYIKKRETMSTVLKIT